jgi:tetratricopeptide (TPR) repeat protein
MTRTRTLAAVGTSVFVLAAPAAGQFDNVGSIDFPTSATGEAQQHFLRGVAILHSFGWAQAIEQFQAAQEMDADFAMAYWGESLAYNHPLFSQMDATEPSRVLARLGPTPEARRAKASTDREKGFLDAIEILWGDGDHVERRVGYRNAMAHLHDRYPDDSEIAAFYALSILSAVIATGDLSQRQNMRAGAIALKLASENPEHPGAAHYAIHAFDDPLHAPLALEAAYRFADIAPAVSHARHMPTHIFIQHGMWDLVSTHNQSAYDAARELWQPGQSMGDAIHALDWGQYGDLQKGDYEKARLWIERIETMSGQGGFLEGGARGEAGVGRAVGANALLRARYVVDTEEWQVRAVTAESSTHGLLATGLSAARLGEPEALREAEAELGRRVESGQGGYTEVMYKQVGALLHAGMGHADVATGLMDEAVVMVEAMAPPRGAANPVKPVPELYGEILLDFERYEEASELFETALQRMPRRPRALLGLARARAALGDDDGAAEAYSTLTEVWKGRDAFVEVQEAKRFLETTAMH